MRLGHDVEMFLQDQAGNLKSVIGYINASKHAPMQIPDMELGFTLQEDNVALEYGIPPAATKEEWNQHCVRVMAKSLEYLPGLSFSRLSAAVFPFDELRTPNAWIFGCEPDLNAWTQDYNPKPSPAEERLRSAGGHVHIETDADKIAVVKAFDLFCVVPSVLMDEGELRKEMYGKAGAHRPKSYGVECRSLSNFWIFEERTRNWVWDNTARALTNLGVAETVEKEIQIAVNRNDKQLARELVDAFKLEVV